MIKIPCPECDRTATRCWPVTVSDPSSWRAGCSLHSPRDGMTIPRLGQRMFLALWWTSVNPGCTKHMAIVKGARVPSVSRGYLVVDRLLSRGLLDNRGPRNRAELYVTPFGMAILRLCLGTESK